MLLEFMSKSAPIVLGVLPSRDRVLSKAASIKALFALIVVVLEYPDRMSVKLIFAITYAPLVSLVSLLYYPALSLAVLFRLATVIE